MTLRFSAWAFIWAVVWGWPEKFSPESTWPLAFPRCTKRPVHRARVDQHHLPLRHHRPPHAHTPARTRLLLFSAVASPPDSGRRALDGVPCCEEAETGGGGRGGDAPCVPWRTRRRPSSPASAGPWFVDLSSPTDFSFTRRSVGRIARERRSLGLGVVLGRVDAG
jgi:hypothetical protein